MRLTAKPKPSTLDLFCGDLGLHADASHVAMGWWIRLALALLTFAINAVVVAFRPADVDPAAAHLLAWLTVPYVGGAIGLTLARLAVKNSALRWWFSLTFLGLEAWQAGLSWHFTGNGDPISLGYLVLLAGLPAVFLDGAHGLVGCVGAISATLTVAALDHAGLSPARRIFTTVTQQAPGMNGIITAQSILLLAIVYFACAVAGARDRWLRRMLDLQNRTIEHQILRRYLPGPLVAELLDDHRAWDQPRRTHITVMFSDLVGFTLQAESLAPEILASSLDAYLTEMVQIAHRHGGTVDKFIGDAVMVIFGAPIQMEPREQVRRAIEMAEDMQQAIGRLRAEFDQEGIAFAPVARMGIHAGDAIVGAFGGPQRREFTAVGDTVNLASRLEGHASPGGILVSQAVYGLLPHRERWQDVGRLHVKNRRAAVQTYALSGISDQARG